MKRGLQIQYVLTHPGKSKEKLFNIGYTIQSCCKEGKSGSLEGFCIWRVFASYNCLPPSCYLISSLIQIRRISRTVKTITTKETLILLSTDSQSSEIILVGRCKLKGCLYLSLSTLVPQMTAGFLPVHNILGILCYGSVSQL